MILLLNLLSEYILEYVQYINKFITGCAYKMCFLLLLYSKIKEI